MRRAGARILLIDDEEVVRELLGEILRGGGYEVISTANVEEATTLVDDPELALIITDLVVPHDSGLDLVAVSRRRRPDLSVLIITGAMSNPPAAGLTTDIADRLLAKPFTHTQLLEAVAALLHEGAP